MSKERHQFDFIVNTDSLQPSGIVEPESATDDLLDLAGALHPRQKISLIKKLITELPSQELENLQKLIHTVEQNRLNLAKRVGADLTESIHRIKIKKDYNFRKLGLAYPQQYYVAIGAKYRIHSDIYLGVLFYVETGYSLDYVTTQQGIIQFKAETSVFLLRSSESGRRKIIRLVMLTPPPSSYSVSQIKPKTRYQTPCSLHVEILDENLKVIERERHPFPACMFNVSAFDRDYWNLVTVVDTSAVLTAPPSSLPSQNSSRAVAKAVAELSAQSTADHPVRLPRVIDLSRMASTPLSVFAITNRTKTSLLTSYLSQVAELSRKAFPKAPWRLTRNGLNYRLHYSSNSLIVEIKASDHKVLIEGTCLNTLATWCRELGVEVSQQVNSGQYSDREQEIARNLMIEFSASIPDSITFVEKFFHSVKGTRFRSEQA